jgi:prophage regulatory protein
MAISEKKTKSGGYPKNLGALEVATVYLRLPQICAMLGVGHSTIYYWIAEGKFPKQIKLGQKLAVWRREDVEAFMRLKEGEATNA